jgi:hypothetical protein
VVQKLGLAILLFRRKAFMRLAALHPVHRKNFLSLAVHQSVIGNVVVIHLTLCDFIRELYHAYSYRFQQHEALTRARLIARLALDRRTR